MLPGGGGGLDDEKGGSKEMVQSRTSHGLELPVANMSDEGSTDYSKLIALGPVRQYVDESVTPSVSRAIAATSARWLERLVHETKSKLVDISDLRTILQARSDDPLKIDLPSDAFFEEDTWPPAKKKPKRAKRVSSATRDAALINSKSTHAASNTKPPATKRIQLDHDDYD